MVSGKKNYAFKVSRFVKLCWVTILCLVPFLNAYAEDVAKGNLFDSAKKPKSEIAVAATNGLTAKFARSRSSEKFNGEVNEKLVFVGDDPSERILPADKTPPVRVNKDAPGPFIAMKKAYDEGDIEAAHAFADQYVRYMQRVMFEVRELSQMVGEALVKNGVVEEDDWVGVSQYLGRELARNKGSEKVSFKATADVSLERIKADANGKAEIYVFCSVTSTYCREMGPSIERIYRLTKSDPNIKFGVYTVGTGQNEWLADFKSYAGMSMPIQDGNSLAKQFRVSFVPSVVIRAPTLNRAYLRTGMITFPRFFEFVRTVQGKPTLLSDGEMRSVSMPIGLAETGAKSNSDGSYFYDRPGISTASSDITSGPQRLQRF